MKINPKKEDEFYDLYYNTAEPGSFSGLNSFINAYKNKHRLKRIPKKLRDQIKSWFLNQDTYTLHKPKRKNYKRNRIYAMGIDDTWQADLVDVSKIDDENDEYKYILTCIDVFSKFAWAIPLKNKSTRPVISAFTTIFKDRVPKKLHCDQGNEFVNAACQKFLVSKEIKFYYLNSEMKASIIERFNRTLKEKMWRYFTYTDSKRYIDVLDQIVNSYNNSYHRSIKMKPVDVNKENENKVWINLYSFDRKKYIPLENRKWQIKFKVNDKVRISLNKKIFEKGYTPNWSQEIFIVNKVILRDKPVYQLRDLNNTIIKGVFYEEELQEITKTDEIYQISEVLKTRKYKGKTQYFVSWKGYPKEFNSWVTELI